MKDTFIYRRVSTNEERQDIDRQLQPSRRYCEENNLKVINEFKDSVSGSVPVENRKGYSLMLKAVEKHPNKKNLNIVFDEISRLGRRKHIINNAIDFFTNQGINVHFLSPQCKMLDEKGVVIEMSDMIVTIFAQLAESELNRIKHRTITSVPRTAEKGHSLGGYFALGYTTDEDGKIIIHKAESELVKLIFELYTNIGAVKVANFLNENGYKTKMGRKFEPTTILKIIQNRNYLGERIVLGKMYRIDSIIDKVVFDKANKVRSEKRNYRNHTRINVNPFVGIAKCGCGSKLRVRKKPDRIKVGKLSFVCQDSNNGTKKCKNFSTIDYNLLCNSVLCFFEKIIGDYSGDDEKIAQLNQELLIKQSEYQSVTKSMSSLQDSEDDLYYEKSRGNIDKASRFKRLLKRLQEDNKKDIQKEKSLKKIIGEIEEKIDLFESKKSINGITDIYDLKFFGQKFLKEITINTVSRKILPYTDIHFKDKRNIIYEIRIRTTTGHKIHFFTGSLSRVVYWKAYNRKIKESYNELMGSLRSGWHGGTILELIEEPITNDVYIVRKNLDIFDIRHGNHYNARKEAELKND